MNVPLCRNSFSVLILPPFFLFPCDDGAHGRESGLCLFLFRDLIAISRRAHVPPAGSNSSRKKPAWACWPPRRKCPMAIGRPPPPENSVGVASKSPHIPHKNDFRKCALGGREQSPRSAPLSAGKNRNGTPPFLLRPQPLFLFHPRCHHKQQSCQTNFLPNRNFHFHGPKRPSSSPIWFRNSAPRKQFRSTRKVYNPCPPLWTKIHKNPVEECGWLWRTRENRERSDHEREGIELQQKIHKKEVKQ